MDLKPATYKKMSTSLWSLALARLTFNPISRWYVRVSDQGVLTVLCNTPKQEQALLYLAVPLHGLAYTGTWVGLLGHEMSATTPSIELTIDLRSHISMKLNSLNHFKTFYVRHGHGGSGRTRGNTFLVRAHGGYNGSEII
jgi:hypothetical protein